MTDLTLRIPKGTPITYEEMDSNLLALDSDTPFKVSDSHVTYKGNIGIGVDSTYRPTYNLDFGEGDSNNEATIGTSDADLHVHVDGARDLKVSTNTQERLTLTTQGNLGINQPNPEFPLDIDGNARITGTFRGNQFRAYSFSDSADLTISNGSITNAKRIVSTNQIDFSRLYDRQTGYKVDHIDSVITLDSAELGIPTTRAVYDALESDRSSGSAELDSAIDEINQKLDSNRTQYLLNMDSEHLWNLSEHQDLQDNIDSLRDETISSFDSEHAWNVAEHNTLQDNINAEEQARSDADSDINARIDSEHAWNVAEHNQLEINFDSSLDSEHAWNVAEHNQLQANIDSVNAELIAQGTARHDSEHAWNVAEHNQLQSNLDSLRSETIASFDSEHAWNVAEHNQLQSNLDAEAQARADADSDLSASLNASLDSEHAWNIAEHNQLQVNVDAEAQARADADSDLSASLNASLDSEHAWNVAEHNQLQSNLDAEAQARSDADSDINDRIDSEHAWNLAEHNDLDLSILAEILARANADSDINARIDSEHAWNVVEHDQLQSNVDSLRSETLAKLDSEHSWNLSENNQLQVNIDSVNTSLNGHISVINNKFDSVSGNLNQLQININNLDSNLSGALDSLEGSVSGNLDSDITIINNKLDSAENRLDNRIDSEHAWNIAEHNILQSQFDNLTTDSVAEGDINLYYTNARVDARNDSTIDSNFLNNRMPLGNLSDVQLTTPDLNEVLQWNGSVWSNQSIGIAGTIEFRGTVDATVDAAPGSPTNGDFYINLGRGNALASWVGLSTVDSGDGLAWDSDATNWRNLGATSSSSVVRVQAGTAISVDETDTARPVVAVRKDVTDTWYYTQSQIDSDIKVEHDFNVAEHNQLQVNVDAEAQARSDADSDINARIDSEHAWNVVEHDELQSNIDSVNTSLNGHISVINNNFDSLEGLADAASVPWTFLEGNGSETGTVSPGETMHFEQGFGVQIEKTGPRQLSFSTSTISHFTTDGLPEGSVNLYFTTERLDSVNSRIDSEHAWNIAEHNTLQDNIDAEATARTNADSNINARIDSEHAWNVVEHDELQSSIDNLDSSLRAAIDSLGINIDGDLVLEISQIEDRIDSEHAWNIREHGKLDSALDSEHAWNVVEHDGLQSSIDLLIDSLNSHISITNNKFDSVDGNLNQLQININNLDSEVTDRLDSLQLYVDNVVNINIGNLDSDLTILQDYVDSFVAVEIAKLDSALDSEHAWNIREHGKLDSALDSEHAWNVAEHYALDSSLRAALDSLGENITAGLVISDSAPADPSDGDLWMSTTEETVYIYDGEFWFEFPGTGNTYASLAIGDTAPNLPSQGTMWMDNTEGVVKIYDGDFWFDWPWPDISSGDFGYLDSVSTESMIDSALSVFEGGLDSASVQEMVDSTLSNPLTIANGLTIDAAGKVGIGTSSPGVPLDVSSSSNVVAKFTGTNAHANLQLVSAGTTNRSRIQFGDDSSAYAGSIQYLHGDDAMTFLTNAVERMRIDEAGDATFTGTVTANKIDGGTY